MAGEHQPSRVVAQLIAALSVLADVAEGQRDWLAHYLREARATTDGDFPIEELALQLEDAAQALPQFVKDALLSSTQERAVAVVTARLSAMRTANWGHLWRAAALDSASEWAEVRRLATAALAALQVAADG
jgi:hypothetical protein